MSKESIAMHDNDGDKISVLDDNGQVYFSFEHESDISADGGYSFETSTITISVPRDELLKYLNAV